MKRPSPASMILGFCLAAIAGLLGYQQYQLIHSAQAWRKNLAGRSWLACIGSTNTWTQWITGTSSAPWRIGQKHPVRVVFFGYAGSSQITCLQLMAKKIAVAQSTSGDVPESGLDSLNQDGDSVEMALARQLIAA